MVLHGAWNPHTDRAGAGKLLVAECGGVRARWALAGRRGLAGRDARKELEQGGLPGSPGSLLGALSKVLKGQLLS